MEFLVDRKISMRATAARRRRRRSRAVTMVDCAGPAVYPVPPTNQRYCTLQDAARRCSQLPPLLSITAAAAAAADAALDSMAM